MSKHEIRFVVFSETRGVYLGMKDDAGAVFSSDANADQALAPTYTHEEYVAKLRDDVRLPKPHRLLEVIPDMDNNLASRTACERRLIPWKIVQNEQSKTFVQNTDK